jgi:hypothetical protein
MLINNKQISIRPNQVLGTLGIISALLVLAHLVGLFMRFVLGTGEHYGLINLGHEGNIPTYFSALILLIAGLLLAVIAKCKKNNADSYTIHWTILSIGFLYLSLDEAVLLHERLGRPAREILESAQFVALLGASKTEILRRAWIIPATALVVLAGGYFARFVFHLPLRSRLLFLVAGTLYIGSVVGLELAGAYYQSDVTYSMFVTLEETGEMASILLFIHTLLTYIVNDLGGVRLDIGCSQTASNLSKREAA